MGDGFDLKIVYQYYNNTILNNIKEKLRFEGVLVPGKAGTSFTDRDASLLFQKQTVSQDQIQVRLLAMLSLFAIVISIISLAGLLSFSLKKTVKGTCHSKDKRFILPQ
jgi:hypothetical protein